MPTLRFAIERITARFLPESVRVRQRETAQDQFEERTKQASADLASGRMTVRDFQVSMQTLIAEHVTRQALLGARGGRLTNERVAELDQAVRRQYVFLNRFADSISTKAAAGNPMSEKAIASRAGQYSKAGLQEYTRSDVENADDGDVYYFWSLDDPSTCSACLDAERNSPYLPDDPALPVPGIVCFGGNRCRCRLERRREPVTARRLAT